MKCYPQRLKRRLSQQPFRLCFYLIINLCLRQHLQSVFCLLWPITICIYEQPVCFWDREWQILSTRLLSFHPDHRLLPERSPIGDEMWLVVSSSIYPRHESHEHISLCPSPSDPSQLLAEQLWTSLGFRKHFENHITWTVSHTPAELYPTWFALPTGRFGRLLRSVCVRSICGRSCMGTLPDPLN